MRVKGRAVGLKTITTRGAWLFEDRFSDDTLRLIGMLYAFLDGITIYLHELLRHDAIDRGEVLFLKPGTARSSIRPVKDLREVATLVDAGLDLGEATMPPTTPTTIQDIVLLSV